MIQMKWAAYSENSTQIVATRALATWTLEEIREGQLFSLQKDISRFSISPLQLPNPPLIAEQTLVLVAAAFTHWPSVDKRIPQCLC